MIVKYLYIFKKTDITINFFLNLILNFRAA